MADLGKSSEVTKLQRDWRSMIFISHDFFHRWRQAVEENFGVEESMNLANRFWELVGESTADSYLKRGKDVNDLAQIVDAFVRASLVMGESARMAKDGDDVLLIHDACPWIDSFKDYGVPGKCQAGCDKWFETALTKISRDFEVQTEGCLAAGDSNCIRRYSRKTN